MTADGSVGADLEVGPAQSVLDLLVALLGPGPQPVEPDGSARPACGRGPVAARGASGRGRSVARNQVAFSGSTPESVVATTGRRGQSGP